MRKKMKPMVIAALIGLMVVLMGCAVVIWGLEDLKLGELATHGQILDSKGNILVDKETTRDLISIHGFRDSPNYQAQLEWFDFEKNYDPDFEILKDSNDFKRPQQYDGYNAYSQEMIEKIDEICEKYGLNLLGPCAYFQRSERKVFFEALDIQSLLVPNAEANVTEMSGYFYEAGNFKVEFDMEMLDKKHDWPYQMYNTFYYTRKENFATLFLNVGNLEIWDQWTYTTSSGETVLIACYDYGAVIFCDKDDSFIYVRLDNNYETDYNQKTGTYDTNIVMTKQQLEHAVDQIDFSIEVETVNMDLAREKLEQFQNRE